ncbi:MAG TPA: hypothetical protein VFR94_15900, partial [Nitrososphaeraceae archaeon]|nr:hypothetical protein [Nitrososphaeraceae archaeon]
EVYARSPLPTPISEHAKHWSADRRLVSLDVSLCVPHHLRPNGLLVIFSFFFCDMPVERDRVFCGFSSYKRQMFANCLRIGIEN